MSSTATKRAVATALAAAAIASSLGAPAASARPVEQLIPGASAGASDSRSVPPPPSSIAASAAEEYEDLRSPDTQQQPVVDEPSGFDLVSAAIGAVSAAGLSLVLMATLSMRRPTGRRAASA